MGTIVIVVILAHLLLYTTSYFTSINVLNNFTTKTAGKRYSWQLPVSIVFTPGVNNMDPGMIGQSMESNSSYSLHDSIEDGSLSSDQSQLLMQELEQTKEEVKDMIHMLDDMRHTFKKRTEDVSVKLRERSWMYTELEDKLKMLPERYGTEIDEIVSLQQEKKERIQYQNNDRLVQITERLRML